MNHVDTRKRVVIYSSVLNKQSKETSRRECDKYLSTNCPVWTFLCITNSFFYFELLRFSFKLANSLCLVFWENELHVCMRPWDKLKVFLRQFLSSLLIKGDSYSCVTQPVSILHWEIWSKSCSRCTSPNWFLWLYFSSRKLFKVSSVSALYLPPKTIIQSDDIFGVKQ